jgi:hypothetical protein
MQVDISKYTPALFYSALFYSALFYSALFYSALFYCPFSLEPESPKSSVLSKLLGLN